MAQLDHSGKWESHWLVNNGYKLHNASLSLELHYKISHVQKQKQTFIRYRDPAVPCYTSSGFLHLKSGRLHIVGTCCRSSLEPLFVLSLLGCCRTMFWQMTVKMGPMCKLSRGFHKNEF